MSEKISGKTGTYELIRTFDRQTAADLEVKTGVKIDFGEADTKTELVGRGHSADVVFAKGERDGKYFAVKVIDITEISENDLETEARMHREAARLTDTATGLIDVMKDETAHYLVMPYEGLVNARKIKEIIDKLDPCAPKAAIVGHLAAAIFRSLSELHVKDTYHLDVKPENLLVNNREMEVKTCDFSSTTRLTNGLLTPKDLRDSDFRYFSPERFALALAVDDKAECEGQHVDGWAAGLSLLELAHKEFNLNWPNCMEKVSLVVSEAMVHLNQQGEEKKSAGWFCDRLACELELSELTQPDEGSLWAMLKAVLTINAEERLSPKTALDHPTCSTTASETMVAEMCHLIQDRPPPSVEALLEAAGKLGRVDDFVIGGWADPESV